MNKMQRYSKIIELINKNDIETQEDLALKLKLAGFNVTQATISRDIRELKLIKIATKNGKQKYVLSPNDEHQLSDKFIRIFKEAVTNIDFAQNMVVIKTIQGMAMAVAASIDALDDKDVLGSIAGDDTIFCITKSEKIAINFINRLNQISKS